MAKEIKPSPSSSAARFLTPESAGQAVVAGGIKSNDSAGLKRPADESPADVPRMLQKVKREFVLTRETDAAINEVVSVLRETSNARLSSSHVLRGLARLLMAHLPAIRNAAVAMGPQRLPATGTGHALARLAFERYLVRVFELAIAGRTSGTGSPDAAD